MFPAAWLPLLGSEFDKPYWRSLQTFVAAERAAGDVYPPADEVFTAFELTPPEKVRVLILGQDPYPNPGQGHGLSFSVKPGVPIPASLRNMYKELRDDLGIDPPASGYLAPWAAQGVFMLNTVLTVRAGEANSHKNQGWETFTDAVIRAVSDLPDPVIFVLWGAQAQKKIPLIDTARHPVIQSAHPSPLSARTGFFGSKPYSKINALLSRRGQPEIDWRAGVEA